MLAVARRITLQQVAIAAVLAIPVAVFFAPTLIAGNAPGAFDLSYQSSPWRDEPSRPLDAQSPVQIDQAEQLPWVDGMWASLREGRVPMWTAAVGGGTALGTNPVFTTYSVFTVVGQLVGAVTSPAIGLAVRVLLATVVAELFAYLFLRRLRLGVGASVFGAVAYVFSGAVIAFETRNAVPLLLPVVLWCTDRLCERASPARGVALAGAVLALWLEGFPAMFVHALVAAGAWWFVRTGSQVGFRPWRERSWVSWARGGIAFGGSMALGMALSAVSAVPFALQLRDNDVFAARSGEATSLGSLAAWWLVDERGLGTPDRGPWYTGLNPFEGVAAVGTLVLVAATLGVVVGALRPARADGPGDWVRNSWAVAVAVLTVPVYLGGPILDAFYALPGFNGNPFSRVRFVIAFGLAVLAALALDGLTERWRRPADAAAADAPGPVSPTARLPHLLVGLGFVVALAAPLVDSLPEYRDLVAGVGEVATSAWRSELVTLVVGIVVLVGAAVASARLAPGLRPWRNLGLGALAAALAFLQVGLHLTRLTPQVDRAFYYPETRGHEALRSATGDDFRFIGSGMGTFAPNTAMVNGLIDARSHSFRDPEWKALVLAVFPDALRADPLKINVDFQTGVEWDDPLFDDLALGVVAMSSSEVPLGERIGAPPAQRWEEVTGDETVSGPGPAGPVAGVDLRLRAEGDCYQGSVTVTAAHGDRSWVARRPLGDVRAAAAASSSLPVALPLGDLAPDAVPTLTIGLLGAPAGCRLGVGHRDGGLAQAPISRPDDAGWEVVSADGGWLYRRPSAHPLVRLVDEWRPFPTRQAALAAAVDPGRGRGDPLPVAFADAPARSAVAGRVTSWSADDHGISVSTNSDGPSLVVAAFNAAPGWSVTVDGREQRLVEPDGALLGVEVPAGDHDVRFEYAMPGLALGSAVSGAAALLALALLIVPGALSRRRAGAGSPGTPADAAPD